MSRASLVLERIRPHPHRGDVIAAGAVPLALAALVIELRMTQWALGARFTVVALIAVLLVGMAALSPMENAVPRPYQSVLAVAGLLPLLVALQLLAEILGANRPPGAGGDFWTFGMEAAAAVWLARRLNSAVCTLIAALAGAIAVEAFVSWVFQPHGIGTFRALTVLIALAYGAGALRLRANARRHAVALVDAAGLVALVLALTLLASTVIASALTRLGHGFALSGLSGGSFGWKLFLLAVGFGLVAYAAVDREPGPAYIGVAVLGAFALLVALHAPGRGSLVGWPLFLLVIGGAGLAIGLRPRQPLPPPPAPDRPAETVPLKTTERL